MGIRREISSASACTSTGLVVSRAITSPAKGMARVPETFSESSFEGELGSITTHAMHRVATVRNAALPIPGPSTSRLR